MIFSEYRYMVLSDLYRLTGKVTVLAFLKQLFLGESYKYIFWMRTCYYTRSSKLLKYLVYSWARLILRHYRYKLGVSIPPVTRIGSGFYIGHFGGIVINGRCLIGNNCNISHGVTLGQANRGRNKGHPTLGNNVYIGPGAKIVGAVYVGNNVAIGANCVVTRDVPDNSVVVGIPGRVISTDGSLGYINRIDYDPFI